MSKSIDILYSSPFPSTRTGALFNAFSYPTKISPEAEAIFIACHSNIGDTIFDGDTQVEISIFDHINKVHMISFKTRISNQGEKLSAKNYDIECTDEYIKIELINFDGTKKVAYRFFFEDFKY